MMEGYYNLKDVLDAIDRVRCQDCTNDSSKECPLCQIDEVKEEILKSPARLIFNGKWLKSGVFFKRLECSVCGYTAGSIYDSSPFCPSCGAKMKGGEQ